MYVLLVFLLKATWVLNGTFDISSCLTLVRKRQYKLCAQFLRLCGHQSMMSDAHRAGANRLQNQNQIKDKLLKELEKQQQRGVHAPKHECERNHLRTGEFGKL